MGGQVHVTFGPLTSSIQYVRTGKLRALAVSSASRSDAMPDIPTVGDFLPGYEATGWFGIGVPRSTPAEIIDKLNKEINAGLADPKMKARLADLEIGSCAVSAQDSAGRRTLSTLTHAPRFPFCWLHDRSVTVKSCPPLRVHEYHQTQPTPGS
jgi:tripartite-type tricarboxylate transporter receptor subunit TctC